MGRVGADGDGREGPQVGRERGLSPANILYGVATVPDFVAIDTDFCAGAGFFSLPSCYPLCCLHSFCSAFPLLHCHFPLIDMEGETLLYTKDMVDMFELCNPCLKHVAYTKDIGMFIHTLLSVVTVHLGK